MKYHHSIIKCELYKPHYFFKLRPRIINFPDPPPTLNYTNDIVVEIDPDIDQSKIIEAAFIKPGAVTHGYDSTQRYIEAEIVSRNIPGNSVTIRIPPDGFIASPGWYMMVVLTGGECEDEENECGKVPSIAKWVRITP